MGVFISYTFFALILFSQVFLTQVYAIDKNNTLRSVNLSHINIPFIKNEGQFDKQVSFYANTFHGGVLITDQNEIIYTIPENESETFLFKEQIVNANKNEIKGENKAITKINYFKGNDRSKWRTNVSSFEYVNLGEIYGGIELKLKSIGNNVEKLFYVKPGADPDKIKIKIAGVKNINVNKDGQLELITESGTVKFTKPIAFQKK